jgi:hypothetical protein
MMRMRSRWTVASGAGVVLAARLAFGGPGTTTTTSSTTTTTLLGGCTVEATFDSIMCRIDALIDVVGAATDLGRFKDGSLKSAQKAKKQCGTAQAAGTGRTALNQLKKCAKTLDSFRHRLSSNNARKTIPQETRDFFRDDLAAPLRSDVNTLRYT